MAPDSRRWLSCGLLLLVDFDLPIELRQAQHRHVQLAGQPLQPPRIFATCSCRGSRGLSGSMSCR